MKKNLLLLFLSVPFILLAQKKTMTHDVYKIWQKIDRQSISNDGNWVAYETNCQADCDPKLQLWNATTQKTLVFPRGTEGVFAFDNSVFVFKIKQPLDSLKAKRRKKVKDEDLPKDSLGIYNLQMDKLTKIANVKSFQLPQKWAGVMAYQLEIEKIEEKTVVISKENTPSVKTIKKGDSTTVIVTVDSSAAKMTNTATVTVTKDGNSTITTTKKGDSTVVTVMVDSSNTKKPKAAAKPKPESKDNGSKLIIRQIATGLQDTFLYVSEWAFAKRAPRIVIADTGKDSANVAGIRLYDTENKLKSTLFQQKGKYKNLAIDEQGRQTAFIADLDTTKARVRPFELRYAQAGAQADVVAKSNADFGVFKNHLVSDNAKPQFSEDGSKLFFGIAPQPILPDTTLLPEEIVNVEVWAYDEPKIHTQQKVQLEADKKRSFLCVYDPSVKRVVPLAAPDATDAIALGDNRNRDFVIVSSDKNYLVEGTWTGGARRDIYLSDIRTGDKTLVIKGLRAGFGGGISISPNGKYVVWYNELDSAWSAYSVVEKKTVKLTDNKTTKFYDEENDSPDYPNGYGLAGWLRDDRALWVYDRYDIWQLDPTGKEKMRKITEGGKNAIAHRYVRIDEDEKSIDPTQNVFLKTVNDKTKAEGYALLNPSNGSLKSLISGDFALTSNVRKAKNAERYIFSKQNFQTSPDVLYTSDFQQVTSVSNINPQQSEYNWGSIELVEWRSLNGEILRGMLVKPEGFDPTKKYPMIVNFYEKSTDQLHNYRGPEPLRSQIQYAFYANRGYVVFNPDIPYRIGYPGESCLNSVLSGVTHLVEKGFIDEKRIGVQGHSWGGYQAAYLVTKTNIFKCAEAGAPVVNMLSAYGGIRWETGILRQFQYEHSQSRIGGSIWEYPLRFMENSPIFTADKIETPVLIMANDKDGAVPWYQGIEFYSAMRRLNKPAWLLNYNEEPHWPVKLQNRIDFQIRMQQFFDYYLKDEPMPQWMKRGVPAMEKGILQGYETEK